MNISPISLPGASASPFGLSPVSGQGFAQQFGAALLASTAPAGLATSPVPSGSLTVVSNPIVMSTETTPSPPTASPAPVPETAAALRLPTPVPGAALAGSIALDGELRSALDLMSDQPPPQPEVAGLPATKPAAEVAMPDKTGASPPDELALAAPSKAAPGRPEPRKPDLAPELAEAFAAPALLPESSAEGRVSDGQAAHGGSTDATPEADGEAIALATVGIDLPGLPLPAPTPPITPVASVPSVAAPAAPRSEARETGDDNSSATTRVDRAANLTAKLTNEPVTVDPAGARNAPVPAPTQPGAPLTDAAAPSAFAARVAETYPAAAPAPTPLPVVEARSGRIGPELGIEIARHLAAGREELTVRLNPADLGRVEIRMGFDDSGSIRAVVAAESPVALELLRRDAGELARALGEAGIRSDAQSFRFDTRGGDAGQSGQRWQHGRSHHADHVASPDGDPETPLYRPLRTSGRVDLMA